MLELPWPLHLIPLIEWRSRNNISRFANFDDVTLTKSMVQLFTLLSNTTSIAIVKHVHDAYWLYQHCHRNILTCTA